MAGWLPQWFTNEPYAYHAWGYKRWSNLRGPFSYYFATNPRLYSTMFDYAAEFIGTFLFLSIILATGQPVPIAIGLLASIYFGGNISGGHFNPAVTTMMLAKGAIPSSKYPGYIAAQILGGLAALWFHNAYNKAVPAQ